MEGEEIYEQKIHHWLKSFEKGNIHEAPMRAHVFRVLKAVSGRHGEIEYF